MKFELLILISILISIAFIILTILSENKKDKLFYEKRNDRIRKDFIELYTKREIKNTLDNNKPKEYPHIPYDEYLKTEHWKNRRITALRKAGYKCQVCCAKTNFNVHHNNYKNLWHELDEDLVVLCNDCHKLFHKYMKLK